MRSTTIVACFILLAVSSAAGQIISGRSPAGSLSAVATDSALAHATGGNFVITYETEFSEQSGDNFLEARETGRLRLILTNSGKPTLRNVVAKIVPLAPPTGLSYNDSISVGDIPGNATRYAIFYFTAEENVPSQILTFQIDVHDNRGMVADSRLVTFLTKEKK
jgi:hypothetical protein